MCQCILYMECESVKTKFIEKSDGQKLKTNIKLILICPHCAACKNNLIVDNVLIAKGENWEMFVQTEKFIPFKIGLRIQNSNFQIRFSERF